MEKSYKTKKFSTCAHDFHLLEDGFAGGLPGTNRHRLSLQLQGSLAVAVVTGEAGVKAREVGARTAAKRRRVSGLSFVMLR